MGNSTENIQIFDKVSIIMPCYNSSDYIVDSIRSIQRQSCSNWELLITDDCSSDNTVSMVRDLADKDNRIKFFQLEKNGGAGVARNNSIRHAVGRYIAFCDSDDQWLPLKLEKQIAFMQLHNQSFSYTSYEKINEAGDSLGSVACLPRLTYKDMLRNNYVGCLTAMYDSEKLGKIYMPHIRNRQDWALWLDILKQCGEVRGIQEPLSIYRERLGSISSNKFEMIRYNWIIFHDIEKLGFIHSGWCMVEFMLYYFLKKISGK